MVGSLPLAGAKRERDVAVALVAVALGLSRTFAAFRVGGASRAAIAGCLMGSIPGSSRSLRLSISGAMHVRASEGESVWRRVPTPIVVVLRVVDARTGRVIIDAQSPQRVGAQVGAYLGREQAQPGRAPALTLAQIATRAGCNLTEFRDGIETNPPVTGRFVERIRTADGSYAGKRPPRLEATIHALFHGRVLFQYRPGLAERELRALDRFTRADADKVLLFENQTGMRAAVAATAYLTLMTCPRVDHRTMTALSTFRERRRAFGQSF
jgi:hypothetical protein